MATLNRIPKEKHMNYRTLYITFLLLMVSGFFFETQAQEGLVQSFKDTRVINTHSVETLPAHKLDVRISHRFGDFAGDRGGWPNFYGLETAADVLIGADYGVTDDFTVGLNRTKGVGVLSRLVNTSLKYRIARQKIGGNPFSVTIVGEASASTLARSTNPNSILFFENFAHRFIYSSQLLVSTVIAEKFTIQVSPGILHRNVVDNVDVNTFFHVGLQAKLQFNRGFALIFDSTFSLRDTEDLNGDFYMPLGFGFEFDTGGHVFQINFTNATGLATTDFIPNTTTNWADGEFRMGFTISRLFNL
jgi:hypothetical protein